MSRRLVLVSVFLALLPLMLVLVKAQGDNPPKQPGTTPALQTASNGAEDDPFGDARPSEAKPPSKPQIETPKPAEAKPAKPQDITAGRSRIRARPCMAARRPSLRHWKKRPRSGSPSAVEGCS